jgi:3'-phosphoadenosine 5'-phosphosulfate sulfotransferase (PAPS reductase)/FAD synthetase
VSDPFHIEGPAIISFSGGRTSAYMLWCILQEHGGELPADVLVGFANTGKEDPKSLDFVRDCEERWGQKIVWLEYARSATPKLRWKQVTYETASRNGEPFSALIDERGYLPNPVARFCTQELKVGALRRWAAANGLKGADNVIGLRADEPSRVARMRGNREGYDVLMPLAEAGITKRDVMEFWLKQNFDLRLPNIGGVTPAGNCDLCFLKNTATLQGLIRRNPELADWWIEQEAKVANNPTFAARPKKKTLTDRAVDGWVDLTAVLKNQDARDAIEAEKRKRATIATPTGSRFRIDRPSYAQLKQAVLDQTNFDFGDESIIDCYCGDAA